MKKLVECTSTGCMLPEAIAREIDAISKSLPTGCEYRTKAYTPEAIQFEPNERAEVSIISTSSVDKNNEVVLPHGVDLSVYHKNPVVCWNHKHELPPVGRCLWVKIEKDDTIRAKTLYPERQDPEDDRPWYIDEVWDMIKAEVLRGKSIGFLPRQPMREATPEELQVHQDWQGAGVWEDVVMVEYSVCPIGMNNDAVVEAIAKGLNAEALKALGIEVLFPTPVQKAILETKGMSLAEAIDYAVKHAKAVKKKAVKKTIDANVLLAQAIDGIELDADEIARMAVEMYKNRGRV